MVESVCEDHIFPQFKEVSCDRWGIYYQLIALWTIYFINGTIDIRFPAYRHFYPVYDTVSSFFQNVVLTPINKDQKWICASNSLYVLPVILGNQ